MCIISENVYTDIIPGLGIKLVISLAIFTLGLKIIILSYNKDLTNDSYYFRVINFFSQNQEESKTWLNLLKKIKDHFHDKCKIYEFDFYNKTKNLNVYYIFSIKIINLKSI